MEIVVVVVVLVVVVVVREINYVWNKRRKLQQVYNTAFRTRDNDRYRKPHGTLPLLLPP